MLYPLTFTPVFKSYVWGGRSLAQLYQKPLPPDAPIAESWEITDRPEGVSVIAHGPLAGKNLRWLMENHAQELFGSPCPPRARFPLLVKILDARQALSIQVHPPPAVAGKLGAEPKTEMWYVAEAAPGAELLAGLRPGTSRALFEAKLRDGTVAECLHRLPVRRGDVLFLPAGRVHAIGAGIVIFEIQQNSDTTYRVFDWNRPGLDGQPRPLHIAESMASINFEDFEPSLIRSQYSRNAVFKTRYLVQDPLFVVDACQVKRGQRFYLRSAALQILGLLAGRLRVLDPTEELLLGPGQFVLLPACLERVALLAETRSEFLHILPGSVA